MSRDGSAYDALVDILETELAVVADGFERLPAEDWRRPTTLVPATAGRPRWTLLELAGHLDVSIGISVDLMDDARGGLTPDRDAVGFFVFPGSEVSTDFYEYAYTMVDHRSPASMPDILRSTFAQTIERARGTDPSSVGAFPGFEPNPLMRVDDFISSRIVEAVVHGIDLTDALARAPTATRAGIAHTAHLLDELLIRRGVDPLRTSDLDDDLTWVRAAAGRAAHPDPRLPLLT
jgi:hypothetical protein